MCISLWRRLMEFVVLLDFVKRSITNEAYCGYSGLVMPGAKYQRSADSQVLPASVAQMWAWPFALTSALRWDRRRRYRIWGW